MAKIHLWDDSRHGHYENLTLYRKGNGNLGHTRFYKKRVAEINLFDLDDLKALKDSLEEYRDSLEPRMTALLNNLSDYGSDFAKNTLTDKYGINPSNNQDSLLNNTYAIHTNNPYDSAYVVCESDHAEFVEYGTGSMGGMSPHPSGEGRYSQTSGDSWVYSVRNGDVAEFYTTYGEPAKPFMYDTYEELQRVAPMMAQEAFR